MKKIDDIQNKLELITNELNKRDKTDQTTMVFSSNIGKDVKTCIKSETKSKLIVDSFTLGNKNTKKRLEYFKQTLSKREALVDDLFREINYLREIQENNHTFKEDLHRLVQQTKAIKKSNSQIRIYRYCVYSV